MSFVTAAVTATADLAARIEQQRAKQLEQEQQQAPMRINCKNCGAPFKLGEFNCSYCGGER